jgi:hypothetical protein
MNRSIFIIAALLLTGCDPLEAAQLTKSTPLKAHREYVKEHLNDPDSSVFKRDRVAPGGTYCGEVNSKNTFGGYVGFQRVIARLGLENSDGYVFFELGGLANSWGVSGLLIKTGLYIEATEARNEDRAVGASTQVESKYEKIALSKVFKETWAKNCSK